MPQDISEESSKSGLQGKDSFNWRESPAHLMFLGQFLEPRKIYEGFDFGKLRWTYGRLQSKHYEWERMLGEHPVEAIKRFVHEDMLFIESLKYTLAREFTVYELKEMLHERGLSTSGTEAVLAKRLVDADYDGMQRSIDFVVVQCTEQGESVVRANEKKYLDIVKKEMTTWALVAVGTLACIIIIALCVFFQFVS